MEPCYGCGASLAEDAEWCGQCYAPCHRAASSGSPPPAVGSIMARTRPLPAIAALPPQVVRSRWRKTTTTFGPLGRVIATFALVLPFVFLVVTGIVAGGLTIFGAGIWGFVIMPWGLRDVWRAGQLSAD